MDAKWSYFGPMNTFIGWPANGWALWVLGLFSACTIVTDREADMAAIRSVLEQQERAWDQGDIPGFMEGYAQEVCFVNSKGTTCGREAVTANYARSYPDKEAMGDLSFSVGEVLPTGTDHAWCTGTWTLFRSSDTIGGGFTLLWQRTPDGWRILRDHTY